MTRSAGAGFSSPLAVMTGGAPLSRMRSPLAAKSTSGCNDSVRVRAKLKKPPKFIVGSNAAGSAVSSNALHARQRCERWPEPHAVRKTARSRRFRGRGRGRRCGSGWRRLRRGVCECEKTHDDGRNASPERKH